MCPSFTASYSFFSILLFFLFPIKTQSSCGNCTVPIQEVIVQRTVFFFSQINPEDSLNSTEGMVQMILSSQILQIMHFGIKWGNISSSILIILIQQHANYLEGWIADTYFSEFFLVGILCNISDINQKSLESPPHFGTIILDRQRK